MTDETHSCKEISKLLEQIDEYLKYDYSDSHSEMIQALCELGYRWNYISDEFQIALGKELKGCLKNYQENAEIVESEQTYTHKVKELVWN